MFFEISEERFFGKTETELEKLLDEADFKNKKIEVLNRSSLCKSFDDFVKWFMAWVPHSTGLPQKEALEFAKDLAKNIYEQQNANLNGSVILSSPLLKVEAW